MKRRPIVESLTLALQIMSCLVVAVIAVALVLHAAPGVYMNLQHVRVGRQAAFVFMVIRGVLAYCTVIAGALAIVQRVLSTSRGGLQALDACLALLLVALSTICAQRGSVMFVEVLVAQVPYSNVAFPELRGWRIWQIAHLVSFPCIFTSVLAGLTWCVECIKGKAGCMAPSIPCGAKGGRT